MLKILYDSIGDYVPFSYYGMIVALNLFTLALISEAAYQPPTPTIGRFARGVFIGGVALVIPNLYTWLKY